MRDGTGLRVRWWFVSCNSFTCGVAVDDDGIVREGAPIVRKFVGQPATNLGAWMRRIGGFYAQVI